LLNSDILNVEAEGVVVAADDGAEGFYGEFVIGALGKAGDGDCSDDAGAGDTQGEAAAVAGVFADWQAVALVKAGFFFFELEADGVGTAMEAEGHVAFSANPFDVVRSGAGQRGVEERLPDAAHVNDDLEAARCSEFAEMGAEGPRCLFVEAGELELLFLERDAG
jgi:hypothetical protein